ncbi:hypothetical protein B7P43_G03050 [Cryptotermes secundus]|uniref:Uncharacterized protein n=1 Tax=Cryptotermes secundus TaxID=105785 RepID=A0A2J7Q4W1_9NEOP|nr:hypothetical protein B7P43_G03050 [Cryptotermes secundus]
MFHIFGCVKITVQFRVKIYSDMEHESDSSKGSVCCALASDFMKFCSEVTATASLENYAQPQLP